MDQDVNAQDHDLFDLHSVKIDHVHVAARDAEVIVWKDAEGVFHADSREETVASGEDVLE